MSYEILQFNLGTGEAQGYVLRGKGEHEGTNLSLSPREIDDALERNRLRLKLEGRYRPGRSSFIKGESFASPDDVQALAEYLDKRFLLAHAGLLERSGGTMEPTEPFGTEAKDA